MITTDLHCAKWWGQPDQMQHMVRTGDQSGNLLWRLETGGEFPTVHMPKVVVILIGTNDLTYADCDDDSQDILAAAPGIISRHVARIKSLTLPQ